MDTAARIAALQQQIQVLESDGEVAAPNTWISSFVVPKPNGKRYTYYRLMSASPKRRNKKKTAVMKRYLGNAKSAKYKRALAAIERRNQIQLLLRQIKKLEAKALKEASVEVSGSNTDTIYTVPQLTSRSTDAFWHQLKKLTDYVEQLAQSLNEERAFRASLLQEMARLKTGTTS